MKCYKPSYAISFMFFSCYVVICLVIAMIPCLIFEDRKMVWLEVLSIIFLTWPLAIIVICSSINLISKLFTKVSVSIDDKAIYCNDTVIKYDDVIKIKYDSGFRWIRSIVDTLVIYGKDNSYIRIERPSYLFMFNLKKICGNKFKYDNIFRVMFLWPTICFIGGFGLVYVLGFAYGF